jgi:CheY-like chemotaxis protein
MRSASGDLLVVDDDPDMAEVLAWILGEAGYLVRIARNGKEALEAVAARIPELVLLDMLMPVMDGWRCARELRARYGRTFPIVVVTAAEHARARAEEVGADDAMSKPFEVRALLETVARHVGKPGHAGPLA